MSPDTSPSITFRPLVYADLPLLHAWLNEPGVVAWWEGDDVSWSAVVRDYGPGDPVRPDQVEHWIAETHGRSIGWAQCYPATAWPEESDDWFALGIETTAAGIDYLVGDPDERGRGLGSAMVATFVERVVFGRHPAWTSACAAPLADNVASWRALENAGFDFVAVVHDEQWGPSRLMRRAR